MDVLVERYIEQVTDGSHYKGHIRIFTIKFDFEIVFMLPIDLVDDYIQKRVKDFDEFRQIIQIALQRDGIDLELSNQEYAFFFSMLVGIVMAFYSTPNVRIFNEVAEDDPVEMEILKAFGISLYINLSDVSLWEFSPELCDILNSPKFGCNV